MRKIYFIFLCLVLSSCGIKQEVSLLNVESANIVQGESLKQDDFLEVVWLYMLKTNGSISYCSGTLISSDLVLTAAHCLKDVFEINAFARYIDQDSKFKVAKLKGLKSDYPDLLDGVSSSLFSPDYYSDFGFLRVSVDNNVAPYLKVTTFPTVEEVENWWKGDRKVTAVGYGTTGRKESGEFAIRGLNKVEMQAVSASELIELYKERPDLVSRADAEKIQNYLILVGDEYSGTAPGDSGGPSFINTSNGFKIIGVHSRTAPPDHSFRYILYSLDVWFEYPLYYLANKKIE